MSFPKQCTDIKETLVLPRECVYVITYFPLFDKGSRDGILVSQLSIFTLKLKVNSVTLRYQKELDRKGITDNLLVTPHIQQFSVQVLITKTGIKLIEA